MRRNQVWIVGMLSVAVTAGIGCLVNWYSPWKSNGAVPVQQIVLEAPASEINMEIQTEITSESKQTVDSGSIVTSQTIKNNGKAAIIQKEIDEGKEEAVIEDVEMDVSYPLELNTASVEELETLPGIGAVLAQRIVAYRETYGGFINCAALMEVDGIGDHIYEQILPYVYVEGEIIDYSDDMFFQEEAPSQIQTEETFMLEINTATAEEFQLLPGVTPEIAENIIALRSLIQKFQNPYELLYADGMTDALFVQIRDYLYIL